MNKLAASIAKDIIRQPWAWPGGYPKYAITDDGAALCPNCCKSEFRNIAASFHGDGWAIVAADLNYEDIDLCCDHCSAKIPTAYED